MSKTCTAKRAEALSGASFLIFLSVLIYTDHLWPEIILALGFSLAIRYYLLRRFYNLLITLLVTVSAFLTQEFESPLRVFFFFLSCLWIGHFLNVKRRRRLSHRS
jgi:hypothetical protein